MLRLLSDENFNGEIVRGLFRAHPTIDLVRVQDVGLSFLRPESDRHRAMEFRLGVVLQKLINIGQSSVGACILRIDRQRPFE